MSRAPSAIAFNYLSRRAFFAGAAASIATPASAIPRVTGTQSGYLVNVPAGFRPYEIHVVPGDFALFWTLPDSTAIRYTVGVAPANQWRAGTFRVRRKEEWPTWTPTANMIRREPDKYLQYANGVPPGPENPLGSPALYLYRGRRDTYLRIHGTHDPSGIGTRISNGCVRMLNPDVEDLYTRTRLGTVVRLHP